MTVEDLQRMSAKNILNLRALADEAKDLPYSTLYRRVQRGSKFHPNELRKLERILRDHGLQPYDEDANGRINKAKHYVDRQRADVDRELAELRRNGLARTTKQVERVREVLDGVGRILGR